MNRRLLLLFATILVLVMVACAPPPNIRDENNLKDTSLLNGEPCEAPCWNNIVPGETTYRDAKIIIEDDTRFQNVQEAEFDEETTAKVFGFSDGEGPLCCQILSEDGEIVDSLLLLLAPRMTLGEVIDKYGDPTYLLGDEVTEDQALISLIYPDVPMVIYVFVAGSAEGELTEGSDIIGAIYMTEDDMERIINTNSLYEWDGYASFADYIDENYDFVGEDVGAVDELSTEGDTESEGD